MKINKHIFLTIIPILIFTSCNNPPDVVSADNYYQLRKQLFHYKFIVDKTKSIKTAWFDFSNDSLDLLLQNEAEKVSLYIDTIKSYLIDTYKIKDPYNLTREEIVNYNFKDSLFAYASLNKTFCGELGEVPNSKYNAYTLHKAVKNYFDNISKLTGEKSTMQIFYPNEYKMSDGVKITWEYQYFFKNNLITTLTNLEQCKQDIYSSSANIQIHRKRDK
jgi:hypothetical protein